MSLTALHERLVDAALDGFRTGTTPETVTLTTVEATAIAEQVADLEARNATLLRRNENLSREYRQATRTTNLTAHAAHLLDHLAAVLTHPTMYGNPINPPHLAEHARNSAHVIRRALGITPNGDRR